MMPRALPLAAACAILVSACLSGPWPGRPPRWSGPIQPSLAGQDADLLQKLGGDGAKYPSKVYWIAAPDWRPVRSSAGIIIGRRTGNAAVARLTRFDGSKDGWPDLCEYKELTIREEAADPSGTKFDHPTLEASTVYGEVDCQAYDSAR